VLQLGAGINASFFRQADLVIIGIVAIARNLAIGRDGKLPWHYPADLRFFKKTTMGKAVLMGARTWRSIGCPLPGRLNLVLSGRMDLELPDAVIRLTSKIQAVELATYLSGDIYLIGGARTYREFADVIEQWLVTEIPETIDDADTFMPHDFLSGFNDNGSHELEGGLLVRSFVRA
jgi:dihydrofolate reductase